MVLFLIPSCHLSNYNFSHNLIQMFPQLVAGLDRVGFFWVLGLMISKFWLVLRAWSSHPS